MRSPIHLLPVLLLACLLGSCGAYFNTYYNAHKAFEDAQKVQRTGSGRQAGQADYNRCLKISSKLLQFYPESRLVDDTILMIGQCYVQMNQHHRALRKFDELEQRFPESRLLPESRIWRARSLLELKRNDACRTVLAGIDAEALGREDHVELQRVWADLYEVEENLERLVETQRSILRMTRRKVTKGELNAEIARSYVELGDYEQAVEHFGRVKRHRPGKAIELDARLGVVDNLIRLRRFDRAASRIRSLHKDERFYEDRHRIVLREARLAEARGDLAAAMERYHGLLEDFPRTTSSAAAAYAIGALYIKEFDLPDSAKVYYGRTRQESSNSSWADSSGRELEVLGSLEEILVRIDELDSLILDLDIRLNPDSAFVRSVWARLPDLKAAMRRDSLAVDSLRALQDSLNLGLDSLVQADSLLRAEVVADTEADSLAEMLSPQAGSTIMDFLGTEGALPGGPSSPVLEPGAGRRRLFESSRKQRERFLADSLRQVELADSLRLAEQEHRRRILDSTLVAAVLDTSAWEIQVDSTAILHLADSLNELRFDQRFQLAEVYYLKLRQPEKADSMMLALQEIEEATAEQASRLLYAYGTLRLEHFGDSTGTEIFRRLVDRYPLSLASNPARERLGLPPEMTIEDSAAILLGEAERSWLADRDPLQALDRYDFCQRSFPDTPQAYNALVAAGMLAHRLLENPVLAADYFQEALRRFPEEAANDMLRGILGQDLQEEEIEEQAAELPDVELQEVLTDESGRFVLVDEGLSLEARLQVLRDRFARFGRLKLERILN